MNANFDTYYWIAMIYFMLFGIGSYYWFFKRK